MPSPTPQAQSTLLSQPDPISNGVAQIDHSAPLPELAINGEKPNGDVAAASTGSSIQEGKQKAKEVMAASGVSHTAFPVDEAKPVMEQKPKAQTVLPNGSTPSRKRSRSGTRISHNPRSETTPDGSQKRKNAMLMEQYVNREQAHADVVITNHYRHKDLLANKREEKDFYRSLRIQGTPGHRLLDPAAVYGKGYDGRYANKATETADGRIRILYPAERRRAGGKKTPELRISKKDLTTQSEQFEELVPIRIDIEWDKVRLRDTFTWNLHDRTVTPTLFAQQTIEDLIAEDLQLSLDQCRPLIQQFAASIQEQIQDFYPPIFIEEEALDPHLPYNAYKDDEMRILVKLNITIGQHTLVDQFEWDINNPLNSPEQFAEQMTNDLSLSGEFTTAIAHSIREQSQLFVRSLYVTGHPFDGRPVEDQELKAAFLASPLPSSFRPYQAAKEYMPYIYALNEAELEKTELSISREERRQKRSVNRRGGPALPDLKDRRRTVRTMVVSSVLPYAAETVDDSRLFKRAPTASGRGRRPGYGQKDDLDDSEESESEESAPNSPATIPAHLLSGTARTRGMRGAATVAQAAMRGTLGRSATPEFSNLHHHETRTSGRRSGARDYREESVDDSPPSLIVKFHIPRERYKQFMRDQKARAKSEHLSSLVSTPGPHRRSKSITPSQITPNPGAMGPPPTTPGMQQAQPPRTPAGGTPQRDGHTGPSISSIHPHAAQIGRVDAIGPPSEQNPVVSFLYSLDACEPLVKQSNVVVATSA